MSGSPSKVGGARDLFGAGSSKYDLVRYTSIGGCSYSWSDIRVILLEEEEVRFDKGEGIVVLGVMLLVCCLEPLAVGSRCRVRWFFVLSWETDIVTNGSLVNKQAG